MRALFLTLILAGVASAQAPSAKLTCEPQAASVELGGRVEVTLTLTNTGESPLELPALADDRRLASLDVQLDDGPTVVYEKIHGEVRNQNFIALKDDFPKVTLQPGETSAVTLGFPAVAAGTYTITGHYGRVRPWSQVPGFAGEDPKGITPVTVQAAAVKVQVTPDAEGHDALAVRILTTHGPMRARLFTDGPALGTALHFADLIQHGAMRKGTHTPNFYDGLIFHRAVPGFMIQGGDPNRDGSGGPGYMIPAEIPNPLPDELKHKAGQLSMARSGHPDSAGSQFYVCVADCPQLDARYTVFGELTHGLDVAITISQVERVEQGRDNEKSRPVEPIVMDSVRLIPFKN